MMILQFLILYKIWDISNAEPLYGSSDSIKYVAPGKKKSIALITDDHGVRLCTATLILKDQLLTAASCLEGTPTANLRVIFGSTDSRSDVHRNYSVKSKVTYENWCANEVLCFYEKYTDDLCILKLDVADTGIKPAIIGDHLDRGYTLAKVVGWGRTYITINPNPERPREAAMMILEKSECERRVRHLVPSCLSDVVLPDKILCAISDPPVLAVEGDFGGPVFLHNKRHVSGILIQRCPSSRPWDVNARQVNLILKLSYFQEFIKNAVLGDVGLDFQ